MYVASNSSEGTVLEKPAVFNVFNAQIIYSSFSGSCYAIFLRLEDIFHAVTPLGKHTELNKAFSSLEY